MVGRLAHHLAVVRRDHMIGVVELGRADADVAAADLVAQLGELVILADRRQDHDPEQPLPLQEQPHIVEHPRRGAVDRPHHHFEIGAVQRLEDALLHVEHHLRVGIVVDQPDQEVAPKRQRPRLRIGHVAEVADHLLDPLARFLVEQRRAVDDPADGLLRHVGEARDIVDRRLRCPRPRGGLVRHPAFPSSLDRRNLTPVSRRRKPTRIGVAYDTGFPYAPEKAEEGTVGVVSIEGDAVAIADRFLHARRQAEGLGRLSRGVSRLA